MSMGSKLSRKIAACMFGISVQAFAAEQPSSGLGQQVAGEPPQVVYPRTTEIVQDQIDQIEDFQLTPEQFEKLKEIYIEREKQKASPYISPAKPVTRTLFINLDPGTSPPVLRLSSGQQTSIVFSDASGNPWVITNVSLNRQLFSDGREGGAVQAAGGEQQTTNVLSLEPKHPAAYGNVTITLRGLSTPVIFVLTTAQQEVDMRVDAKVPGRNPDALDTVAISTMPSIDGALSYFLDGVPPPEAKPLKITGAMEDCEAWLYRDNLYVRTKGDAQYPAYLSAARSTSGIAVYRYANLHNALTFTTGGQAVTVFIE